jgi:HTH-type transcriptional regulator/antitoxin HigA
MAYIKNKNQHKAILKRIECLMEIVHEDTLPSDPDFVELDILADLVEEYETEHYPIGAPYRAEVAKHRVYEMSI